MILIVCVKNESTFIAILTTRGRVTRKEHSKTLKAVKYNDKIYFSRHRPDSDWFKNIMVYPDVTVQINEKKQKGFATVIQNQDLSQKISELKYPGQTKAKEKRVTVEIKLCE